MAAEPAGRRGVLLLHGQPGSPDDWDRVRVRLDGLDLLVPARPGYDGTPALGLPENARILMARARAAGFSRLVVVGHSLGGGVALQMAWQYPELVAGLCLVGSVGSTLAVTRTDRLLALGGVRLVAGVAACLAAVASPRLVASAAGSRLDSEALSQIRRAGWRGLAERAPVAFAAEQRLFVAHADELAELLPDITAPVQVVTGDRDTSVVPAAAADLAARLQRAELITVPGGHLLPMEAPDAVAAVIRDLSSKLEW